MHHNYTKAHAFAHAFWQQFYVVQHILQGLYFARKALDRAMSER